MAHRLQEGPTAAPLKLRGTHPRDPLNSEPYHWFDFLENGGEAAPRDTLRLGRLGEPPPEVEIECENPVFGSF